MFFSETCPEKFSLLKCLLQRIFFHNEFVKEIFLMAM